LLLPSDAAWSDLPKGTVDYLMRTADNKQIQAVTLYHIVNNALLYTNNIPNVPTTYTTASNGSTITVEMTGGKIVVNGVANFTGPASNLLYSNGVAQVIDKVLFPPTIQISVGNILQGLEYTTFLDALVVAGLGNLLNQTGDHTFFSPNNTVWNNVDMKDLNRVASIAKAHVVPTLVTKLVVNTTYPTLLQGYSIFVKSPTQVVLVPSSLNAATVSLTPSVVYNGAVYEVSEVFDIYKSGGGGSGLSPGIIVLIVFLSIFGVLVLAAIGFAGWWFVKKRGTYRPIN